MSPYKEALSWIQRHPGTGGANSLAKLILSLWNDECGFSFRECIHNLDEDRTALAVRMVSHFATHGEDSELVEIGHEVCGDYPRLWDLGQAADQAKNRLRGEWEKGRCQDIVKLIAEQPGCIP
jgi:hypothetical protein